MELYCTRPGCPRPRNVCPDLDDATTLKTVPQKYCTACGMPLLLLGRYLPQKLLGRGGFGAAYGAIDRYTPSLRPCVVKQFQPSVDLAPEQWAIAQSLFEREAEALEQLGNAHPQIPDLFAFFPLVVPGGSSGNEEFFYLVQEFIDGQTMEEELAARGPFSEKETLEVLISMLKVLKFVHEHQTIHRDIKLSNIMRHRNGLLYLLDFGAVKQVTKTAGGSSHRSTGIYSVGFAPPEQVAGGQVYPSTDLYALAVTCITLLTGREPSELYDAFNNSWQWRSYASVSPLLADVLDRMLLPVPKDRFQSVHEVAVALRGPLGTPAPASASAASPSPATLPVPPTQTLGASGAIAPPPRRQSVSQAAPVPQAVAKTPAKTSPSSPAPPAKTKAQALLVHAGFLGFEGALVSTALLSTLGLSSVSVGILGGVIGVLAIAQFYRLLRGVWLLVVAFLTFGCVAGLPWLLGRGMPADLQQSVLWLLAIAACAAVTVAAIAVLLHRLIRLFRRRP